MSTRTILLLAILAAAGVVLYRQNSAKSKTAPAAAAPVSPPASPKSKNARSLAGAFSGFGTSLGFQFSKG